MTITLLNAIAEQWKHLNYSVNYQIGTVLSCGICFGGLPGISDVLPSLRTTTTKNISFNTKASAVFIQDITVFIAAKV